MDTPFVIPSRTVKIGEHDITITPLKVKEIPSFTVAVEPLVAEIQIGDIAGALLRNAESLISATCIGARVERAWLDDQQPDALVELAGAVMEVNIDFFASQMLPLITAMTERMATAMEAAGRKSS